MTIELLGQRHWKDITNILSNDPELGRNGASAQKILSSALPNGGWEGRLVRPFTWAFERVAFAYVDSRKFLYKATYWATAVAPYGMKEISGKKNLESIAKGSTVTLLPPHISEGDYAFGPYFRHEGLPQGHPVAGLNLITDRRGGFHQFVLKGIFDSERIIRIDRDGGTNELTAFRKVIGQVHDRGANTIIFPGASRDRTNSAYGTIGERVLKLLLMAQEDSEYTIYAVPVTVTWDRQFRAQDKVGQNVTGYVTQGASELGDLVFQILEYSVVNPFYVHVGKPLNLRGYLAENEHMTQTARARHAAKKLARDYNEELTAGIYATPSNLAAAALKSFSSFQGSVTDLADEVKKAAEITGIQPQAMDYSSIAAISSTIANSCHVSNDDFVSAIRDRLAFAHAGGILMPAIVSHASGSEVLRLAERRGALLDFASYDVQRDAWHMKDGLLAFYYAGAINKRIEQVMGNEQALHST